jgi:hypothetical protein
MPTNLTMPTATAVAGASGGAVSSLGGGGTAVAGAASAIGGGAIAPILGELSAAITQLTAALQPISGGGASPTGAPVTGGGGSTGCGCSGASSGGGGGGAAAAPTAEPVQPPPPGGGGGGVADKPKDPTPAPVAGGGGTADPGRWLTGDLKGLDAKLTQKLAMLGERLGQKLTIASGSRTFEEQTELYNLYKAGKGNLAAKPGTSNHEHGDAADVNVKGTSLANYKDAKSIAAELGLHFPVPGEAWHVEVK